MCRIFVPISTIERHMPSWRRSEKWRRAAIWSRRSSLVVGWWNVCIPGSIAPGAYWFAGRNWISPIKRSCIWLVASSAFNTVITFFPYWFPNKLLGAGAILSYLSQEKSPEAWVCEGAFIQAQDRLETLLWDCGSGRELGSDSIEEWYVRKSS